MTRLCDRGRTAGITKARRDLGFKKMNESQMMNGKGSRGCQEMPGSGVIPGRHPSTLEAHGDQSPC